MINCRITNSKWIFNGNTLLENVDHLPRSLWLKEIYKQLSLNYPKFYKMDLLSKSTFLAVETVHQSKSLYQENIPLIFANSSGSYTADEQHTKNLYQDEDKQVSPATFVYTLPNIAMGELSIRHQLHSKNVFFIFDSFDEINWEEILKINFQNSDVNNILLGWTEVDTENLDIWISLIPKDWWMNSFSDIPLKETYYNVYKLKK